MIDTNDPNADLIGFSWTDTAGETVTVVETQSFKVRDGARWMEQYVRVRFPTGHETIKPAAVVRRRKELENA